MKKKDLVQRLRGEYYPNYPRKKVYKMVNFLLERMKDALLCGEELKLYQLGTFKKRGKRVVFKASKRVLERLKSEFRQAKMYL